MNFVVFDLEATCEENNREYPREIIEIGAVKYNDEGEVLGEFNQFVKPIIKPILSPFCIELTSIQQSDVDGANLFPIVIQEFDKWITKQKQETIICSWGYFDKSQIKKDCLFHNVSSDFSWLNRHISLKHQFMELTNRKRIGMAKALRCLNLKLVGSHHRGIDDARNLGRIFTHKSLFTKWDFKERTPKMIEFES